MSTHALENDGGELPPGEITRRLSEHAELHGGRRNFWLRTLDRFALGFDF